MADASLKVLIMDDEEGILDYMHKILNLKGYQTVMASNGPDALKLFESENPDICILDVHLTSSPIDGVEVLRQIKQTNEEAECVMVTRITDGEKISNAREFGAAHYLLKPLDTKDLLTVVNVMAKRIKERRSNVG